MADIDIPDGSGNKFIYDLDLRANGQVSGFSKMKSSGILDWAMGEVARDGINLNLGFMMQPTPMEGNWSYVPGSGLSLNLVQSGFGQKFPINLQIHTSGTKQDVLIGTGPGGSQFTFRRK